MRKAINNEGKLVEVAKGIPVKTKNGVHYLHTPAEQKEYDENIVKEERKRIPKQWKRIRIKRDRLLKDTDWTQLSDSPQKDQQIILNYRQALRNITKQPDPFNISWPIKPDSI